MANDYYTHGSTPAQGSPGASSVMRAEFDLVMAGFAKLPALTANAGRAVVINGGGTGMTVTTGTLALGGAFITSGGHSLTLTTTAPTNVTLPTTGTLATRAGTETFTNKTLTSPVIQTPTISAPTLSGTYTLAGDVTIATTKTSGHGIGVSVSPTVGLGISLNTTGAGSSTVRGINQISLLTAGVNDSAIGVAIATQVTKAGSGTHNNIDGLFVQQPVISGSATCSVASTLRIPGAPSSGATSLYALNVEAGVSRFNGRIELDNGQLKFPASPNASADPNTLDDYEEGTWTPSLGGSATYTSRTGTYTKIGRLVILSGVIVVNAIGTGSTTQVSGIPFAASGAGTNYTGACSFTNASGTYVYISAQINSGASVIIFPALTAAAASTSVQAIFTSGTAVSFTVSYFV